jgi:hypothetical protein
MVVTVRHFQSQALLQPVAVAVAEVTLPPLEALEALEEVVMPA